MRSQGPELDVILKSIAIYFWAENRCKVEGKHHETSKDNPHNTIRATLQVE